MNILLEYILPFNSFISQVSMNPICSKTLPLPYLREGFLFHDGVSIQVGLLSWGCVIKLSHQILKKKHMGEVKELGSEREGLPLALLCFLVGVSADTMISMLSGSPPSSSIAFTQGHMTIHMIMGISTLETMIQTLLCFA